MVRFVSILLAMLVVPALVAAAAPWPDMKGTWKGRSDGIAMGQPPHYTSSNSTVTQAHPASVDITLEIIGQDGRRVWGTISGGGYSEAWLAVFGRDGRTLYGVDQDGYTDSVLLNENAMDTCYRHTTPTSMLATCVEVQRQK